MINRVLERIKSYNSVKRFKRKRRSDEFITQEEFQMILRGGIKNDKDL